MLNYISRKYIWSENNCNFRAFMLWEEGLRREAFSDTNTEEFMIAALAFMGYKHFYYFVVRLAY